MKTKFLRIVKGNKFHNITEGNWNTGFWQSRGWKLQNPTPPPAIEVPVVETKPEVNTGDKELIDDGYEDMTKKQLTEEIVRRGGDKPKPALKKGDLLDILYKM